MTPEKKSEVSDGILRACELVHAFHSDLETIGVAEFVRRTGLKKTTVFRALQSLVEGGILERCGDARFRCLLRPVTRRGCRIGYAAQAPDSVFVHDVTEGMRRAAKLALVELVEADNHYSPKIALRSAEKLIRERVDLVVEFQTFESVAHAISEKLRQASIPLIAIDIPHPGATYFGADNYNAGRIGGHAAAQWVSRHWGGKVDEILLLTVMAAGPLPNSRLGGFCAGLREGGIDVAQQRISSLDSKGGFGANLEAVRKHLRTDREERILVASLNDPGALGALRAFEEGGRLRHCAVVSYNACALARAELRRPATRLIGAVAYFPERYGDGIMPLALDILARKSRPPAVFIKHALITAANVNHYYPNDSVTMPEDAENLLMRYGR